MELTRRNKSIAVLLLIFALFMCGISFGGSGEKLNQAIVQSGAGVTVVQWSADTCIVQEYSNDKLIEMRVYVLDSVNGVRVNQ